MSGVWTEKSVPMTDHECAVEALEEVGATILASNENHLRIKINGNELRVEGKKRDDLQAVMKMIEEADTGIPLQFINFRD